MAYLGVDQSKMQRAKDAVMAKARIEGEAQLITDPVKCVMFDSRIDHTLIKRFDDETQNTTPGWRKRTTIL